MNDFEREHERLLEEIEADMRAHGDGLGSTALKPSTRRAMAAVPRHEFVPPEQRDLAYWNRALPIGLRQTISQPFIVALMTDLLALGANDTVLEIGSGCGYQAAVLAEIVKQVYSVEFIDELAKQARARLAALAYRNIEIKVGDGNRGWPEHAPYDGIIVTAAAERIPPALIEQLRPGARLVIPIGAQHKTQWLTLISKDENSRISEKTLLPVAFVPLVNN